MYYKLLLVNILLGIILASVGAHPKFCNLDLIKSIKIGFISGVCGFVFYLFFQFLTSNPLLLLCFSISGTILAGFFIVLWVFFRDPERISPEEPDVIVSPADGKIVYIREIEKGVVPSVIKGKKCIELKEIAKINLPDDTDGYIIGICMSILDVHVTRSPLEGTIVFLKSFVGDVFSPKSWKSEVYNPRTTLAINNDTIQLIIVEIGTPYVSKILSFFKVGDIVKKGQRIGKITWGSQVDIIIPTKCVDILIEEGDLVCSGETLIANLNFKR